MIPTEMPDTSKPLPPNFFINSDAPQVLPLPFSLSQLLGRNPPAKSPLTVVDGIDIPPEPPARADEESNIVAKG